MSIALEIQTIMAIESIQVSFVSSKLLNLYCSQKQKLFSLIFHTFGEEFVDLSFEFLNALSFESKTII